MANRPRDRFRVSSIELVLLLVPLMWGANFPIIKVAFADWPPILFTTLRFAIALAVMLVLTWASGAPLRVPRSLWPRLIVLGLIGNFIYQVIFMIGADRTSAGNGAILLATVPVFIAGLGSIFGMERVRPLGWVGVVVSLLGTALIVSADAQADLEFGGASFVGNVLVLTASVAWAVYSLAMRGAVRQAPALTVTCWSTAAGLIPLVLVSTPALVRLFTEEWRQVPSRGWTTLLVSSMIGIALPYVLWNYGVQKIGSARTSLYSYLVPLVALVAAWQWLGETLSRQEVAGAALILGGVLLARRHVTAVSHRSQLDPNAAVADQPCRT